MFKYGLRGYRGFGQVAFEMFESSNAKRGNRLFFGVVYLNFKYDKSGRADERGICI